MGIYNLIGLAVTLAGIGLVGAGAWLLYTSVKEHPATAADAKIVHALDDQTLTDASKELASWFEKLIPLLKDLGHKAKVGFIFLTVGALLLVSGFAAASAAVIGTHDAMTAQPSPSPSPAAAKHS
jgi:hypothetical protein